VAAAAASATIRRPGARHIPLHRISRGVVGPKIPTAVMAAAGAHQAAAAEIITRQAAVAAAAAIVAGIRPGPGPGAAAAIGTGTGIGIGIGMEAHQAAAAEIVTRQAAVAAAVPAVEMAAAAAAPAIVTAAGAHRGAAAAETITRQAAVAAAEVPDAAAAAIEMTAGDRQDTTATAAAAAAAAAATGTTAGTRQGAKNDIQGSGATTTRSPYLCPLPPPRRLYPVEGGGPLRPIRRHPRHSRCLAVAGVLMTRSWRLCILT